MELLQKEINLKVQLYADSDRVFLRVWKNVMRKGKAIDCTMRAHQIPVSAGVYLSPDDRTRVLNLTRRFFTA